MLVYQRVPPRFSIDPSFQRLHPSAPPGPAGRRDRSCWRTPPCPHRKKRVRSMGGNAGGKTWEYHLVGGFNHLEKYESQWEGLSHILWKMKNV